MLKEMLQNFVDGYGFGISKEKIADKAYRFLQANGFRPYIINEKYIGVDRENEFQFIKSKKQNRWIVEQF